MLNDALYVYGIIKGETRLEWKGIGIDGKGVYTISENGFSALVHDCEEKPFSSDEPDKIKNWIIIHDKVLNKAMKEFDGVIPFSFNTIVKNTGKTAEYNLKAWLSNDSEILERTWDKVKGKREYGIKVYYDKSVLVQKASAGEEVKKIEESQQGKGEGLKYLLKERTKSKIDETVQNDTNQLKQEFYNAIKSVTEDLKINTPKISISDEKDLLLSMSVLANKQQIKKIKDVLKEKSGKDFIFQMACPFAPYSFVENDTK